MLHLFVSEVDAYTKDYILASDLNDAKRVMAETTDEDDAYSEDRQWKQWPDDQVFPCTHVDEPGQPVEDRTARQICDEGERGYWGGCA